MRYLSTDHLAQTKAAFDKTSADIGLINKGSVGWLRGIRLHARIFVAALTAALLAGSLPIVAQTVIEETPFLLFGKVYADPNSGIEPGWREQIGDIPFQYPNAAACITKPSGAAQDLLEADLRWFELPTKIEVEVCLFRVFSALGSLERIEDWLTRQGWEGSRSYDRSVVARLYGVPDETITVFIMYWNTEAKGAPYGSEERQLQLWRKTRESEVQINWASKTGAMSVRLKESSKWQK